MLARIHSTKWLIQLNETERNFNVSGEPKPEHKGLKIVERVKNNTV